MKRLRYGIILFIGICILAGCGKSKENQAYDTSTLIVGTEGKLTAVMVSELDKDIYNIDGLKKHVDDEIYQYNYQQVENSITVNSVELDGKTAKVNLSYKDYKAYQGLNEVDFYMGTVSGAMKEGYLFDTGFLNTKNETVTVAEVTGVSQSEIVILSQDMNVELPNDILYVSENVQITGKKTATTQEGKISYIIYK